MQNFYKIGKIVESHFNNINNNVEYADLIDIILDYTKDDVINCKELKCKTITIGDKWKLYIDGNTFTIKNIINDTSSMIIT